MEQMGDGACGRAGSYTTACPGWSPSHQSHFSKVAVTLGARSRRLCYGSGEKNLGLTFDKSGGQHAGAQRYLLLS